MIYHALYGLGPKKSLHLFQVSSSPKSRDVRFDFAKMKIWKGRKSTLRFDLPRIRNTVPLIGDSRNDENFILSQLHVNFILFHNYCADIIDELSDKKCIGIELFRKTRRIVILYYHLLIVCDYLPKLVSQDLIDDLLSEHDKFILFNSDNPPYLSKEFSEAAFRMGHSQVRNSYSLTKNLRKIPLFDNEKGDMDLVGFTRDRRRDIDWEFFFKFLYTNGYKSRDPETSRVLDTYISIHLHNMPFADLSENNLVRINLRRSEGINLIHSDLKQKI